MRYFLVSLLVCASVICLNSCDSSSGSADGGVSVYSPTFYFKQMANLTIDVVYESGAEPYVGTSGAGLNYWDVTLQNLQAVFTGRNVSFTVPKTLAEMRSIPTQNRSVWSTTDAINLANQYRNGDSSGTSGKIFIAFVKGYAAKSDGSANTAVIGYSVTGTNVIIIFKQVVQASGVVPSGPVPRFVEQSTIVHELAHAIGFVNNGIPTTTAHHDSAHGAHCSNPSCVMYYLNEGASDLANFISNFQSSQNAVMFDNACLDDAKSF